MRKAVKTPVLLLIAACGGGGDGSTDISSSNSAPALATANADQEAFTFVEFSYDASQDGRTFSDPDGDVLAYAITISPDAVGLTSSGAVISGQLDSATDVEVTIVATDPAGGKASNSFVIFGEDSAKATSQCPATGASSAAVNSVLSVTVDAELDERTVTDEAFLVSCDGTAVQGLASLVPGSTRLMFVPDAGLPATAACEAEVQPGVRSVDGRPLRETAWRFATGETSEFEWAPRAVADILTVGSVPPFGLGQFGMHQSFFGDGQHAVLFSQGGNFFTAVSADDGVSYVLSDPILDPIWTTQNKADLSFHLGGGKLHMVFRTQGFSQVTGLNTLEVVYLNSTDFLHFSPPSIISEPHDLYSVFSPGVVADDERTYISWEQRSCFECSPLLPEQGVYLAEYDNATGLRMHFSRLVRDVIAPYIGTAGGKVILTWILDTDADADLPGQRKEIYNYTDSTRFMIDDTQGVGARPPLRATGPSTIMYSWGSTDRVSDELYLNYILYDTTDDSITYHLRNRTYPPATLVCPARLVSDGAGNVARSFVTGDVTELFQGHGTIEFSSDAGSTFRPVMEIDTYSNNWCPLLAVKDSDTLFVTVVDSQATDDPEELTLRAMRLERSRPCQ